MSETAVLADVQALFADRKLPVSSLRMQFVVSDASGASPPLRFVAVIQDSQLRSLGTGSTTKPDVRFEIDREFATSIWRSDDIDDEASWVEALLGGSVRVVGSTDAVRSMLAFFQSPVWADVAGRIRSTLGVA